MIIYLGPLSPKDSSDLPGSYPSPSAQDESLALRFGSEAGHLHFLTWSCSQVGFAQTRVTTGTGGLLHHLFTLTLRLRSGRSVFCGTFRPFRMNPEEPTCYVAPCPVPYGTGLSPGELGLSSLRLRSGRSSILLWQL
jgi:hypothetical protein